MIVYRANIPDHDRRIRQARDDPLAIGREARTSIQGHGDSIVWISFLSCSRKMRMTPRRLGQHGTNGDGLPVGRERQGLHVRTRATSISRRTWPVRLSSQAIVLVTGLDPHQLPARMSLAVIFSTTARLSPSGANAHADLSRESLETAFAAGDVYELHPAPADQGERPAIAREDGPGDVGSSLRVSCRG